MNKIAILIGGKFIEEKINFKETPLGSNSLLKFPLKSAILEEL
jgi:hypothetical protein